MKFEFNCLSCAHWVCVSANKQYCELGIKVKLPHATRCGKWRMYQD